MAQVEQLFLLEILVDNIKLNNESIGTEEEPIRVRVKFIEFPWFEIDQHQELEEDGSFNSGKSHLFPMAPVQLIKNLQRYPLAVTVMHVTKENPVPDLIGQTRVKMTDGMTEAVQSAMHCNCNATLPITYTLKDTYSLRNIGGEVGTISLFIRLTCFGQSIVTQFQLGGEKKAFLFQHSKADNGNVCKQRESKEKTSKDDPTQNDILTSSPFLTDEDTLYEDDCPCGDSPFTDETTINWKLPPPPPPPPAPLACGCPKPAPPPDTLGCGCPPPADACVTAPSVPTPSGCSCGAGANTKRESSIPSAHSASCPAAPAQDDVDPKCGCDFEDGDVSSLPASLPNMPTVGECTCGFADSVQVRQASSVKGSCGGDGDGDNLVISGKVPSRSMSGAKQIASGPDLKQAGDSSASNHDAPGRKPSILVKEPHESSSTKRVSVQEAREQKVHKKRRYNFSHKYGVQYPGVKHGHLDCVLANCQVPAHMGWLWNAKCPQAVFKPSRKGWRPGAIGLTIAQIINRHRREAGLSETNKPPKNRFKRGRKVGKDGKVEGDQPPTLHVHRKDGAYYISMHPLNLGGESEQIPLEFTIPKRTGSDYDSESTESELEFDFMAPGAFEPKKPPVKFRSFGTQYVDKDCSVENLQLKGGKGKKDKKGGKGSTKGGKKAGSTASGPDGKTKGGMSWDADPPTALDKKTPKKKK